MTQSTTDIELTDNSNLNETLHITKRFSSEALRTGGDTAPRWLTWATGNSDCFAMNGKTAMPAARGWIIDQPDEDELYPDDYELIDAMEVLVERGLATACMVVHQDKETKKPRKVASWALPMASLFVLCEGVPSKAEMGNDTTTRWGVAYGWRPGDAVQGPRSELVFQVFIKELMDAGCDALFMVSFSSYCTDKALACLKSHEYVLDFADGLRTEAGETQASPYYAYALPIACSTKTITAGRELGKTKELYYPVPAIPRLSSRRCLDASVAFLATNAVTAEQAMTIEQGGRIEQVVAWSIERSRKILAGKDTGEVRSDDDGVPLLGDADVPSASYPMPF